MIANRTNPIEALRSKMLSRGVVLPDQPIVDSRWHECEVVSSGVSGAGRYLLVHFQPLMAMYQNLIDGREPEVWLADNRTLNVRQMHLIAMAIAGLPASVMREAIEVTNAPADTPVIVEQPRGRSLKRATDFLTAQLASGNEIESTEIRRLAAGNGISDGTLRRAGKALRIEAFRRGYGRGGRWSWRLNREPKSAPSVDEPVEQRRQDDVDHDHARDSDEPLRRMPP